MFVFLLLLSNLVYAGEVSDNFCHDPKCIAAADAAQEAFLIQSGIKPNIELFKSYLNNELNKKIDKTGFKKEIGTAFYLYNLYKTQTIQTQIYGKTIILTPNSISIKFDI